MLLEEWQRSARRPEQYIYCGKSIPTVSEVGKQRAFSHHKKEELTNISSLVGRSCGTLLLALSVVA